MFFSILYFLFCSIFVDLLIKWSFLNGGTPPSPRLTTFTLKSHVNTLKEAKQPRLEGNANPPNVDRYAYSRGVCLLAGCDCTAQSVNLYLVSDTPVQTPRHTCHLIILANGGALTDLRRFKLKVLWEMKENLWWDFVCHPSISFLHLSSRPLASILLASHHLSDSGCENKARRDGGEILAHLVATYYFLLFPPSSRLVCLASRRRRLQMRYQTGSLACRWGRRAPSVCEHRGSSAPRNRWISAVIHLKERSDQQHGRTTAP